MDFIDKKILRILQQDAKISNTTLAEQVSLSPSACLRRVQTLEQKGIIDKYVTLVKGENVNLGVQIMLSITLTGQGQKRLQEFEDAIKNIPNVMACFLMGGDTDYIIRVAVKDLEDYAILHRDVLSQLPHVATLNSSFVMRQVLQRTAYPL